MDKIFQAKGRPGDNPLIVHIAHREAVDKLTRHVPAAAKRCMDHFWPGPLTLILPADDSVPRNVTAGLDSVGVRMPDHPAALGMIAAAGVPVAAPSANRSGRPSPTTAEHVLEDLSGRIAGVVEGGASGVGVESTVLDFAGGKPMILRPGSVTKEMLEELLETEVGIDPALAGGGTPRSPGVKYTHYAPKGEMFLVEGADEAEMIARLVERDRERLADGWRVGILTTEENVPRYAELAGEQSGVIVIPCGQRRELATVAAGLYDAIRVFDQQGADVIYAETFPEQGMGVAIMNRLRKAAGHRVIRAE